MGQLKSFLDKYDLIVFDMDGVMTSEQGYWDAAALTVYELLNSNKYFGSRPLHLESVFKNRHMIRKHIFLNDKAIVLLKNKGINLNWDLAYVMFCANVTAQSKNPDDVYAVLEKISDNILNDYEKIAVNAAIALGKPSEYCMREGELWNKIAEVFQKWYFGTDNHMGVMDLEEPMFELKTFTAFLNTLSKNKRIAYGTGRNGIEITTPFSKWNILDKFDKEHNVSYDYVIKAEKTLKSHGITATLTKPNPYIFLQAALGIDYDVLKIYNGDYDKNIIKKTLIVGDAGSDILAAQAAGFDFCAVLTGANKEKSRPYFEKMNATYIFNSVLDFVDND